jgi:hypothetical protein
MLQKSDVRHSSGSRGPTPEIGQQQHRRRPSDQDKSRCETLDYKSHVHLRRKRQAWRRVYHREVAGAAAPTRSPGVGISRATTLGNESI